MFTLCLCFICRWFGVRFDGAYRSARMLVSVGADARIGRRGCSYRSTRMVKVRKKTEQMWLSTCSVLVFYVLQIGFCLSQPDGVSRQYPDFS